jgi:hypothetical protein
MTQDSEQEAPVAPPVDPSQQTLLDLIQKSNAQLVEARHDALDKLRNSINDVSEDGAGSSDLIPAPEGFDTDLKELFNSASRHRETQQLAITWQSMRHLKRLGDQLATLIALQAEHSPTLANLQANGEEDDEEEDLVAE